MYPPVVARERNEVVFVDGVRTAFGKAGPGGLFWQTRADDMAVKALRELLRRNPQAPAERIGEVVMAASSTWATTPWARRSSSTRASSPSA